MDNSTSLPKIVAILGPTASGKTGLAIALAKEFNGEIVNADSRQVYKRMNIGTAKPEGVWVKGEYLVEGVPHYLMDIIEPDQEFNLSHFKAEAIKAIETILKKGKLPIIVGGTGLYFWSLIDNLDIPHFAPNPELRQELEEKTLEELVVALKEKDPETAGTIDLKNPRRVIRALEVVLQSGKSFIELRKKGEALYSVLQVGLFWDKKELEERIALRVADQFKSGLKEEVEGLVKAGYSWNLPSMSGIGYHEFKDYLEGNISLSDVTALIIKDTMHYAKRQMTWFKRDVRIQWLNKDDLGRARSLVRNFIQID